MVKLIMRDIHKLHQELLSIKRDKKTLTDQLSEESSVILGKGVGQIIQKQAIRDWSDKSYQCRDILLPGRIRSLNLNIYSDGNMYKGTSYLRFPLFETPNIEAIFDSLNNQNFNTMKVNGDEGIIILNGNKVRYSIKTDIIPTINFGDSGAAQLQLPNSYEQFEAEMLDFLKINECVINAEIDGDIPIEYEISLL